MKFSIKTAGKSIMTNGKEVGLIMGGALLSAKFLNFDTMMANQSPDSMLRKHQGIIKVIIGAVGAGMVPQKSLLRPLLMGVALEGGIKAVRTYGGGSFFPQLGADDSLLGAGDNDLADILEGAESDSLLGLASVTDEYSAGVAGLNSSLTSNSQNAVSGFGGSSGDPYRNTYR